MKSIKKIKRKSIVDSMNQAFKYGAKEGENNNPYRALKTAQKAVKTNKKK